MMVVMPVFVLRSFLGFRIVAKSGGGAGRLQDKRDDTGVGKDEERGGGRAEGVDAPVHASERSRAWHWSMVVKNNNHYFVLSYTKAIVFYSSFTNSSSCALLMGRGPHECRLTMLMSIAPSPGCCATGRCIFAEALTITSHKRTNFTATSKSDDATKPRPGTPLPPRHGSMHVSVVSSIHRFHGYDVNSLPPIKPEALRVSLAPCELGLEALKARIATGIHKFELEALTTTAAVTATCI